MARAQKLRSGFWNRRKEHLGGWRRRHGKRRGRSDNPERDTSPLPNPGPFAYMWGVPSGTMAINAHVISGSDPGAVPGGSTRYPGVGGKRGRNSIDGRLKVFAFARLGATVIGPKSTVANDNRAPVAIAA